PLFDDNRPSLICKIFAGAPPGQSNTLYNALNSAAYRNVRVINMSYGPAIQHTDFYFNANFASPIDFDSPFLDHVIFALGPLILLTPDPKALRVEIALRIYLKRVILPDNRWPDEATFLKGVTNILLDYLPPMVNPALAYINILGTLSQYFA